MIRASSSIHARWSSNERCVKTDSAYVSPKAPSSYRVGGADSFRATRAKGRLRAHHETRRAS